jgi:hypothetical protein
MQKYRATPAEPLILSPADAVAVSCPAERARDVQVVRTGVTAISVRADSDSTGTFDLIFVSKLKSRANRARSRQANGDGGISPEPVRSFPPRDAGVTSAGS